MEPAYEEPGRAVSERKPGYPPVIAGWWLPTYGAYSPWHCGLTDRTISHRSMQLV